MGRLIYHRLDKHLPTVIEIELLDSVLQYLVCFRITRARGVHMHLPLLEVELRQSFYAFACECNKLHRHNSDHIAHWQVVVHSVKNPTS